MTKPKAKTTAKTVVKKKAPKKIETKPVVEMESYEIKMVIPTGQYANVQPKIVVKSNSMEEAHKFIAPHMNKLWKEYYLVNERRPEPVKAPVAPAPTPAPPVNHEQSHVSKPVIATTVKNPAPLPAGVSTTSTGALATDAPSTTDPKTNFNYLKDPKAPDEKVMTAEDIAKATGGKVLPNPEVQSPSSSVALIKATQAIESCMSLDALELIRAQVDKSVKLTPEDKEAVQPLLLARLEVLTNGI